MLFVHTYTHLLVHASMCVCHYCEGSVVRVCACSMRVCLSVCVCVPVLLCMFGYM